MPVGAQRDVVVRRNCSLSPAQSILVFGLAGLVPSIAALFWAFMGAWLVLPFAGLELVALGVAFWMQARHAVDSERIFMEAGKLVVEITDAGRMERHEFDPARTWLRDEERRGTCRLSLGARGEVLEVGRHWDSGRRRELGAVLRQWLDTRKSS